jgi:hypothetical protein
LTLDQHVLSRPWVRIASSQAQIYSCVVHTYRY